MADDGYICLKVREWPAGSSLTPRIDLDTPNSARHLVAQMVANTIDEMPDDSFPGPVCLVEVSVRVRVSCLIGDSRDHPQGDEGMT